MTVEAWERGLAGGAALLAKPPYLRQGWTEVIRPANPAAGAGIVRKVPNDTWERMLSLGFTVTDSAVNTLRQVSLAFADQDGNPFAQVPIIGTISGLAVVQAFGSFSAVQNSLTDVGRANSSQVTSPTAGQTITSVAVPAGEWVASWQVEVDGTTAVADDNNFQLVTFGLAAITSENGHVAGQPYPQPSASFIAPAAGVTVVIKAVAAGTVGAVYVAQVTLTQVTPPVAYFQVPDLVMKSGWQYQVNMSNEDAGDQFSGITMLLERYPSSVAAGVVP